MIKDKIINLVNEYSNKEITKETNADLIEEDYISSFTIMNLVPTFEDEFDIELSNVDICKENFKTIGSMEEMISKKING